MNKFRLGNLASFIISVLLVVLGVWTLASGRTHDRSTAWIGIFFFALSAAVSICRLLGYWPSHPQETPVSSRTGGVKRLVFFYGIKIAVPARKKKRIETIEAEKERAARQTGLETISFYIDKIYFCYIGRKLGTVGVDFDEHIHYTVDSLAEISADVQARLKEYGLKETPSFHMEFEF